MFKISLYPEYHLKKRAARQRTVRMALLLGLLGLEVALIGSLVLSASLLQEQTAAARHALPRLSEQLRTVDEMQPEVELAQQILKLRSARIDWSPKLAALGQQIDPSLRLVEVTGQAAAEKRPARLEMGGEVRERDANLEQVSKFIDELRADQRITADFTGIRLGTLKGGTANRFRVICTRQGGSS